MKKILFKLLLLSFPVISFGFFCPTNFNQIEFHMTLEQVNQICGKPDKEEQFVRKNDENLPQEWSYFIPQIVSMHGRKQNLEGTLKTSVVFDDNGRAVNISVNGIGVGATFICGHSIQLGDDKSVVRSACGDPSFILKQTPPPGSPATQEIKVRELFYTNTTPPAVLIFENGRLKGKRE